jgi:hypothetical protein
MSEPCCASCGLPFANHLGVQGCCAQVLQLRRMVYDMRAIELAKRENEIKFLAGFGDCSEEIRSLRATWDQATDRILYSS